MCVMGPLDAFPPQNLFPLWSAQNVSIAPGAVGAMYSFRCAQNLGVREQQLPPFVVACTMAVIAAAGRRELLLPHSQVLRAH
jgi:hypothetical protein